MGLRAHDVRHIEDRLGVELPAAYASFLRAPDLAPWARLGRLSLTADAVVAATLELRADVADGVFPVGTLPSGVVCIGGDRSLEWLVLDCGRGLVHVVSHEERTAYLVDGITWDAFREDEQKTSLWMHLARWNDARSARPTYVVTRAGDPAESALEPIDAAAFRAVVARDPDLELTERERREDRETCEPVLRRAPGRIVFRAAGVEWDLDFRHGRLSFCASPVPVVEEKMRELARRLGAAFVAI